MTKEEPRDNINKAKQKHTDSFFTRNHTAIIVTVILFIITIPLLTIATVNVVNDNRSKNSAVIAENARIAADPISVAGIFNASNKARAAAGAQALSIESNLNTAAQQKCDDMVANKYLDYKNPTTGKDSNSYIIDNKGELYITSYVSDVSYAIPKTQTATDFITERARVAPAITDTRYNSVGWAVCQPIEKPDQVYIVAMEATKAEKPAPTNNYYSAPATNTYTPSYTPPKSCSTTYNPGVTDSSGNYLLNPSSKTTCY
jgi:hypothetical protein